MDAPPAPLPKQQCHSTERQEAQVMLIFNIEIGVSGHSRSLKVVSGFPLVFFSNFVPKTHHF